MPDGTGEIIESGIITGGKSDADAGTSNAGGTAGRSPEPEILYGSDGPDTERIRYAVPGDGIRRTKSGKPDGRTLRGKRTTETTTQESVPLARINLEDAISTTNIFLAGILSTWLDLSKEQDKLLEIDKSENKALADAITEVARYHAMTFDPKKVAYFNLALAVGSVYGTRAFALWNMRKANEPAKVVPIKPAAPQPDRQRTNTGAANGRTGNFSPSELFGDQGGGL